MEDVTFIKGICLVAYLLSQGYIINISTVDQAKSPKPRPWWHNWLEEGIETESMDQIAIKTPNPKFRLY